MLAFVPLSKKYLEWARLLHNDPEVLSVLTDDREVSQEGQAHWFAHLQESRISERLVVLKDDEPVGVIRLDNIDRNNRSICVGLDIHKDFRGQGLAKPIYYKLLYDCFVGRNFNRVWLFVAEFNRRAFRLYYGLGFEVEGYQREALFRGGKFHDYVMMSILKKEWIDG